MLPDHLKEQFKYQIPLPGWGEEGQDFLRHAHVVVVGLGGLGSHSALSLARAGVGRFTLIDPDRVEKSNLPRQHFVQGDDWCNVHKTFAVEKNIKEINPGARVRCERKILDEHIIQDYTDVDLFIDGLDNWRGRYLINDFCIKYGIPWVYAGVSGVRGNIYSILPKTEDSNTPWEKKGIFTKDLREVFGDEPKPSPKREDKPTPGILSPLLPIIANMQVIEALKILVGNYEAVCKKFLTCNGWDMEWRPVLVNEED